MKTNHLGLRIDEMRVQNTQLVSRMPTSTRVTLPKKASGRSLGMFVTVIHESDGKRGES
jgi:hypothetical protein